jgi:hypothetical protein
LSCWIKPSPDCWRQRVIVLEAWPGIGLAVAREALREIVRSCSSPARADTRLLAARTACVQVVH